MILSYEYTTHVEFAPSIGQHNILLRCLPVQEAFQHCCAEEFTVSEGFWHKEETDSFGNRIIVGGTSDRHSSLSYSSLGTVEADTYCIPDESPHPMFCLPSRLTHICSGMLALVPSRTGNFLDDCLNIVHVVHHHILYVQGVTDVLTTAEDVFRGRQGVCQDYAHLMISLCRAAGLPARYACGFMMGEGQTHAWVEVHDGHCWYAFDPTNDTAIASGYIKLAHGRDALDCPVSRGMYTGIANETTSVSVKTILLDD